MGDKNKTADIQDLVLASVLDAEKSAEQRILTARAEAASVLEQARQSERDISERAENRILEIHTKCRDRLEQEKQRISAEFFGQNTKSQDGKNSRIIKAAVKQLALDLTKADIG